MRFTTAFYSAYLLATALGISSAASGQELANPREQGEQRGREGRRDATAELLGRLPDDVEVVVVMPAAYLMAHHDLDSATPIESLAAHVGGHALGAVFASDDAAPRDDRTTLPSKPLDSQVDRLLIACWRKAADEEAHRAADVDEVVHALPQWEGIVLLVVKEDASPKDVLRDCIREPKAGEMASFVTGVLPEGIAVLATSTATLEKLIAADEASAAQKLARVEAWKNYRPGDRDPEFWAARRPDDGTGPRRPFLRIGFSAASTADDATLHLTYIFEDKAPDYYVAGAEVKGKLDRVLTIVDYGAKFTIASVEGTNVVCKVRLDEGRGFDAASVTILENLRTYAPIRPGEKRP